MTLKEIERRVELLKEEYPLFMCYYADGSIVTVSGHDALIAAIKGAENENRLVKVEPENPQQTGVCSLANALLTVKEA